VKFVFRLQPLIDRRKLTEELTRQNVALAQRDRDEAKRELDRLEAEFRAHASLLRERHRALLQLLEDSICNQRQVLARRQGALEEACKELAVASKKRAVVEKLKDRYRARATAGEIRAEEAEIDENNARR
jgi:flagellar export protein FliJ